MELHLSEFHIRLAYLLSLLCNESLKLAFLLSELLLVLCSKFMAQPLDFHFFLRCELHPEHFFHLMVNVLSGLCIVNNLLFLKSQALMKQLFIQLAVFGLFNDLPFKFDLHFQARDLLS